MGGKDTEERGKSMGLRIIYHEIKTGKYDLKEVLSKYYDHSSVIRPNPLYCTNWVYNTGAGRTNSPLVIWAWPKYHFENEKRKKDKTQIVWFASLCWLQPILKKRFSEFKEVLL